MQVRTMMEIGLAIRQQRRAMGLTQDQLASMISSTQSWISEIEKGKQTAEIGMVLLAMGAVGLNIDLRGSTIESTDEPEEEVELPYKL